MIGIVTIYDYNFGNRLQNYATYRLLSRFDDNLSIKYLGFYKNDLKRKLSIMKSFVKHPFRLFCYNRFNRKFIPFYRKTFYRNSKLEDLDDLIDCYVFGSDQIWNPNFCEKDFNYYMGGFTKKKKIALSPSIGLDTLLNLQIQSMGSYIKNIEFISCREEQGSLLLQKMCNKKVDTLIDPTLMLSEKEWNEIIRKPFFHNRKSKYILIYFLGGVSPKNKTKIYSFAKQQNLKVIDIYDRKSIYFSCGPSEFVWLIKHCEVMLTDSFHGCIFSYIYNKPLKIFSRENGELMNSRLINLSKKIHLNDSLFFKEDCELNDEIFKCRYEKEYLIEEQKMFMNFLNKAIKGDN